MEDQTKLRCGCIIGKWFCLFCNSKDYIKSAPPNARAKLWERAYFEKSLLSEGVPIKRVREIVFEQCQCSSNIKTKLPDEKEVLRTGNDTIEET